MYGAYTIFACSFLWLMTDASLHSLQPLPWTETAFIPLASNGARKDETITSISLLISAKPLSLSPFPSDPPPDSLGIQCRVSKKTRIDFKSFRSGDPC